jgi:hypothetical protein
VQPSDSPFPCHWWGFGLENVGLSDVRPDVGTYGCYPFEPLPPLPFVLCGDFAWLASAPAHDSCIGDEKGFASVRTFALLKQACARRGVRLPESFTKFMETPALHRRVRSNTDCFLNPCPEPVPSPVGGGHLVRFLADSQGCLYWYLYLTPDGSDHAVVSSTWFYGTEAEQWGEEPPDPAEIEYCAESFEAFLCRFWLENEIWFAEWEKTPMPESGREYIERYRNRGA